MLDWFSNLSADVRAALWGLVAGLALLVGAAIGYYAKVSAHDHDGMAFGAGVLVSALAEESRSALGARVR